MKIDIGLIIIVWVLGVGFGITLYALLQKKIKFVSDGRISGWVFMTIGTLGLFAAYAACFWQDRALGVMDKIGYQMVFAWSSMMFLWGGLKTARSIWGKVPGAPPNLTQQMDEIADKLDNKK